MLKTNVRDHDRDRDRLFRYADREPPHRQAVTVGAVLLFVTLILAVVAIIRALFG
jgi:hypothetical protein